MKAKNNEQLIQGYTKFAIALITGASLSVFSLFCFIRTNGSEYKQMEGKTREYDQVYARQIALVEKVDSLYNYLTLMGSNEQLNQIVLQKTVSTRKMSLIDELNTMEARNVMLYKALATQINVFLETKEAIRKAAIEESLVKNDLMRCIRDNKQAARKLTLGSIKTEQ